MCSLGRTTGVAITINVLERHPLPTVAEARSRLWAPVGARVAMMVWAFGAWVAELTLGRKVRSWQHIRWLPRVALPVVLVWFVVRNLPWAPFQALYV